MSRAWRKGSTTRWRKVRAAVLRRDRYLCTIKDVGCTGKAEHVDHIIPKEAGGDDAMTNLRAACAACNLGRDRKRATEEPPHRRVSNW